MTKLIVSFNALWSLYCLITVLFLPETCKRNLFRSFNFDFNKLCLDLIKDLNENLTIYNIAWFIKWELSLDLNPAHFKIAPIVWEEKHKLKIL